MRLVRARKFHSLPDALEHFGGIAKIVFGLDNEAFERPGWADAEGRPLERPQKSRAAFRESLLPMLAAFFSCLLRALRWSLHQEDRGFVEVAQGRLPNSYSYSEINYEIETHTHFCSASNARCRVPVDWQQQKIDARAVGTNHHARQRLP